jgi:hypothetical protein
LNGSLELNLASILLQASIHLYQAASEWKLGKKPESLAKLLMGMLYFYQSHECYQLIQKKNSFLFSDKFQKLLEQVKKGKESSHLIHSDLNHPKEDVILLDAEGNPYNFGAHVHGHGKEVVKGMNLQFKAYELDGKSMKTIEFKVNHVFRERLQSLIEEMKQFSTEELKTFLALTQSHAREIKIEEAPFYFSGDSDELFSGEAHKITLEGLGTVIVGNSKDLPNLFNRVRLEIEENKTLHECHELLSFFNLNEALQLSTPSDVEKLKMGQLFRQFHPKEASLLERESLFFDLSLNQLKENIIARVPSMKITLAMELPYMQKSEILPGRIRYTLPEIAQTAYQMGARGLISTITGPNEEAFNRLASILNMGMLSTEMRYNHKITARGASPLADFRSGGADSVYTQLLTDRTIQERIKLSDLYEGKVQILFSLNLLNTGTYQYNEDSFGTRQLDREPKEMDKYVFRSDSKYLNRPTIFKFIEKERQRFNYDNEVMIKERICPSMIKGIIIPDHQTKDLLLDVLRAKKIAVFNSEGKETILGKPIDHFVHVATHVSQRLFA